MLPDGLWTAITCNDVPTGVSFGADYGCADAVEAAVDRLVASVDLFDVGDGAGAFGRHCGQQQRYAGADIWRTHDIGAEREFVVMSYDYGTMGIA